jgi:hypothetical protein
MIDTSAEPPVHPANAIFPMMSDDELEELAESIKAHGRLLKAIVLDRNGVLLDGKCRLRACQMAGVEPRFEVFEGIDSAFPGARLPYEEQCKKLIIALNITYPQHLNKSQKALAQAIAATPGCYWEHRVVPEARAVAQHADLVESVMAGGLSLSDAYARVCERQRQAARAAADRQRLDDLRHEQPLLAIGVEEGKITLDQAITTAAEQAAAPLLAEHAETIRFLGRRVITDILEIGRRLTECKALLGHGN